jgi:hypothetical protein
MDRKLCSLERGLRAEVSEAGSEKHDCARTGARIIYGCGLNRQVIAVVVTLETQLLINPEARGRPVPSAGRRTANG